MTGTMTWVGLDVHARSTHGAALDTRTGELARVRFGPGIEAPVEWLRGLPGPVRACYEAGPTGFGLYRAARAAGLPHGGDRSGQDAAGSLGPREDRSQGRRAARTVAAGRVVDGGRRPATADRSRPRADASARRMPQGPDDRPPPRLEAAAAPWPGLSTADDMDRCPPKRDLELLEDPEQHLAPGPGAAGLDEAQMTSRDPRVQRQLELGQAAPLAPLAEQRSDRRL